MQRLAKRGSGISGSDHRHNTGYGENLAYSMGYPDMNGLHEWYNEYKQYPFKNYPVSGCGHFTQMVWRDTKELGIEISRKNGRIYVVANYYPPGNFQKGAERSYEINVPPRIK